MDPRVKTARVSVVSNTILLGMKLIVGLSIGSVSVISEAIHSGLDLAASLVSFFSLRRAARPADDRHRYGHGKYENVAGVIQAFLIFVAAVWIIAEAYEKLLQKTPVADVGLGMGVMAVSSGVNYFVSRYLFRVARATDSIALRADATHLSVDVLTSTGVFLGLGLMKVTGLQWVDPVAAIAVALLIMKAAYDLGKQAFRPLLDHRLPEEEEAAIVDIIRRYRREFIDFHALRFRKAGPERHIDLHLVVDPDQSVADAHAVCDRIEEDIQAHFPLSHVLIHVEPSGGSRRDGDEN